MKNKTQGIEIPSGLHQVEYTHNWRGEARQMFVTVVTNEIDEHGLYAIESISGNTEAIYHLQGELSTLSNRIRFNGIIKDQLIKKFQHGNDN